MGRDKQIGQCSIRIGARCSVSDFDKAIPVILKHEGRVLTQDHAGYTKYGISERLLGSLPIEVGDIDGDGKVTGHDIAVLTEEEAKRLYKKLFWDANKYYLIKDQNIATKILDMAVHMGAIQAHKLVQRALNAMGEYLVVDGILGRKTISAINNVDGKELMKRICDNQRAFYLRLISNNPQYEPYKRGWLNRARYSGEYVI